MSPDIGLANWFYQRAQRTPERKALTFEGVTWTYREVQRRIDALAGRLRKLGVHSGDRVAFLGLNQPLFLVVTFAAARLGAAFVPLNFRLTGPELVFIANDAGACAMVVDTQHRGLIDAIRGELTTVSSYFTTEAAGQWLSIEGTEPAIDHGVRVDPDAAALMMYTSGTTGTPKGAILTTALAALGER
ncbi:AMP-binding protein [Bradyrhizobium sp. OAE829]|uniref:AMP-binding protein n=1 Tax=Bradyrhizobium sp. OAE829 TaxID=2663807 RepID=UPI0017897A11